MTTPTNHDASKVAMGSVGSSDRVVTNFPADPASFPSGLAVRGKSDGGLSTAVGDGSLVGVSLGRSLSEHKKTAVCRAGNHVPIRLAAYLVLEETTILKKVFSDVRIELLDTVSAGSEAVTVTDEDDDGSPYKLISVAIESGVTTATQLKAAIDASPQALALIEAVITGTAEDDEVGLAETAIDTLDHAVIGAPVEISDVTGMAVPEGAGSVTGAKYISGPKTGVNLDGTTVTAAIIDMGGGL